MAQLDLMKKMEIDGFCSPLTAMTDEQEIKAGYMGMRRFEEQHIYKIDKVGAFQMHHVWMPWVRKVAQNMNIINSLKQVFGSDHFFLYNAVLFPCRSNFADGGTNTWTKDKETGFTRCHPCDRRHCVTAYIAFDKCDPVSGGLKVQSTRPGGASTGRQVLLDLKPGEFALVGPSTPHIEHPSSGSNKSIYMIALRYVKASTRDKKAKKWGKDCAMLVSGGPQDMEYNFDFCPLAAGECTQDGYTIRDKLLKQRIGASISGSKLTYPYI